AQYRIGRLYYKFLDNKRKGSEEFRKFVRDYPDADPDLIRDSNKWIKQYEKKYEK
ncbi:MAG: tetratricopeptide repeat protein, partial [Candidatus Aureabacteria bacterium]|nr:tetratricopeptide repeat protein [Candidatus Auribacterota bacterium]